MIPLGPHVSQALERYNSCSRELASLNVERAKMQNAILMDHDDAYLQAVADGQSYNSANATGKSATRRWQQELNKIEGNINVFLVELRYLDQYLKVMTMETSHGQPN